MTPRRAALSLAQASAPLARIAAPARIRAVAQPFLRQYHHHNHNNSKTYVRPPRVIAVTPRQPCAGQSSTSLRSSRSGQVTRRCYSTEAAGGSRPNKIWDFEELQKLTTSPNPSVTIIDVREPGELQQTGRIPGAVNVPITSAPDSFHISDEEFEDRFGFPRPARDAEVVFYCKAGVRSRAAAGLAREAGWTRVGEYPGSWLDWFEKGGKAER